MFPAFSNLALLGGLAAIAAPILIHLLLKRRSQRLRFSSVQFFLKQDEQSMKRRKLRNLLLLATRVLLFILLVLAFARPFLPNQLGGTNARQRQQLVLLLDTSASMRANGAAGSQWSRAQAAVRTELAKLHPEDRVALVSASTRAELISEFTTPETISKKLESLKPGFGTARLADGLRRVTKVLATANPAHPTELCIISDLQRSACDNLANSPLPRELTVRMIDLGDRFIPNLAVTSLQLDTVDQTGPHATITSFSDEPVSNHRYEFRIDGKEVFNGSITVEAGAVTNLPLAVPAMKEGWHSAEFVLRGEDGLPSDNSAFATIYVPPPIHGLVVEPRESAQLFREASYFVATALNPARNNEASASRFTYSKVTLDAIPARLQAARGQPQAEYVIIPAVKSIPASTVTALRQFVENGGGLMLYVGEETSPITYSALGDLLPARLGATQSSPDEEASWRIADYNKTHTMFAVFREPNSGNLALPEFSRRLALSPLPGSTVAAEFQDGSPLLVSKNFGKGRVIIANTSADTAWTDWPKHKTFVPWVHSTALFLAGRDQSHERSALPQFVTDTEVEIELPISATGTNKALTLAHVDGEVRNITTGSDDVLQDLFLDKPGIYLLKDSAGREIQRLAANLPSAESDLSTLAPAEAEQQLVKIADTKPQVLAAGLFGDESRGKELWRLFLISTLALLLLEPIFANRMYA